MFHCLFCKNRWFEIKQAPKGFEGECNKCYAQRTNKDGPKCHQFTEENDMDPVPNDKEYPFHLPDLWETEKQLIARAHVIMRCYIMKKGNNAYKGQCLNIEQDVQQLATKLPLAVNNLPVVWIRKQNQAIPSGYRDFRVRSGAILEWLRWLKQNNPLYAHIQIDMDAIASLPQDGDIIDRVKQVLEREEEKEAAAEDGVRFSGEVEENGEEKTDDDSDSDEDDVDVPMNLNGPEQCGATGNIDNEQDVDQVTRGYIGIPPNETTQSEEERLSEMLRELTGSAENPIAWPEGGENLSDYSTPHLQAMAFPTLFPFGVGDATYKDRNVKVTLTESNPHLLKYAILDENKNEFFTLLCVIRGGCTGPRILQSVTGAMGSVEST